MTLVKPDERHYTAAEIAELWHLDAETIRRFFKNEQGVLKFGREGNGRRRGYTSLRVPLSVMERVHQRMQKQ